MLSGSEKKPHSIHFHLFERQKINFPNVVLELAHFLFWQCFIPSLHFTHNITVTFHTVTGCSWAEEFSLMNDFG